MSETLCNVDEYDNLSRLNFSNGVLRTYLSYTCVVSADLNLKFLTSFTGL